MGSITQGFTMLGAGLGKRAASKASKSTTKKIKDKLVESGMSQQAADIFQLEVDAGVDMSKARKSAFEHDDSIRSSAAQRLRDRGEFAEKSKFSLMPTEELRKDISLVTDMETAENITGEGLRKLVGSDKIARRAEFADVEEEFGKGANAISALRARTSESLGKRKVDLAEEKFESDEEQRKLENAQNKKEFEDTLVLKQQALSSGNANDKAKAVIAIKNYELRVRKQITTEILKGGKGARGSLMQNVQGLFGGESEGDRKKSQVNVLQSMIDSGVQAVMEQSGLLDITDSMDVDAIEQREMDENIPNRSINARKRKNIKRQRQHILRARKQEEAKTQSRRVKLEELINKDSRFSRFKGKSLTDKQINDFYHSNKGLFE